MSELLSSPPEEIRAWDQGSGRNLNSINLESDGKEMKGWTNFETIGQSARRFDSSRQRRSMLIPADLNSQLTSGRDPANDWRRHFDHDQKKDTSADKNDEEDQKEDEPLFDSQPHVLKSKYFSVYFETDGHSGVKPVSLDSSPNRFLCVFADSVNATIPWFSSAIESKFPAPWMWKFLEWNMRSIGQVYFCNNPLSGFLTLVGLFLQSTRVAVHGVVGLFTGNIVALLMGFDMGLTSSGLLSYNGVLVGLAIATFDNGDDHSGYTVSILISTIVTSVLSVIFFMALSKILVPYKSPPLTLPFNLATHMFLLAVANISSVSIDSVGAPSLPDYSTKTSQDLIDARAFLNGVIKGIGQVFLANELAPSLLILIGIGICSRYLALSAFVGSLLGTGVAIILGAPNEMLEEGLYGYNSSLTLAAFALFYVPTVGCLLVGIIAVILTVLAQYSISVAFLPYGLPVLTLPFCVITLPFILLHGTTSRVIAVPLESITIPEDHLRRVSILKDGFNFLLDAIRSKSRSKDINHSRKTSKILQTLSALIVQDEIENSNMSAKYDRIGEEAAEIFHSIDDAKNGFIEAEQFLNYLRSIGLEEVSGLEFASKAFSLMDMNGHGILRLREFTAFTKVSFAIIRIRETISNFFIFVDANGYDYITFHDLNAALRFLEQPALSQEEMGVLRRVFKGGESIHTTDIVNFVTISTLSDLSRDITSSYHTIDGHRRSSNEAFSN